MKQFANCVWQRMKASFNWLKDKFAFLHQTEDGYRDLAPVDNISNGKEYLNALHWAIKNKRIKNIALTGPYGSGKSSIINTYLKQHLIIKRKHIRISMATFIEACTGEKGEDKKIEVKPEDIQEGILKQLFYKIDHRKIPQSRYRKLHKVSFLFVWFTLAVLTAAIVFFAFIFAPEYYDDAKSLIVNAGAKLGLEKGKALLAFVGIVFMTITVLAYIWRRVYSRFKISEVKVKNAAIAPEGKEPESIFNKNMDEIVYFFEETRYRVVFFEDLDRLDSPKIFVQLRELNTLLNNCDTIKQPVVFVYAVKDDIFTEEDRTKFFEFIIPVIPVINSTNSGEIMLDLFKANGAASCEHNITPDYILDISPYISDMRVLQNIYNEFLLYKRTLRTEQGLELNDEMMLSLIIFKNLYPKDFADLQMETGIVKKAFQDKQKYIEKKQKVLQAAIDASVGLISQVNADVLKNVKEIKVSMLSALTNWRGITTGVGTAWSPVLNMTKILNDSCDWSELLDTKDRYIHYYDWSGAKKTENVQNITEICKPYYERCERQREYEQKQLAAIQREIEQNKQIKNQLSHWTLKGTLEREEDNAVLSADVRNNALLVFMLRKGYIDEKYVNYVNYFKGSSITAEDMNYILGVKNHEAKPFDYVLSKVAQVAQRLLPHEFEQKEALNFGMLEYLLEAKANSEELAAMITRLSDGTEYSWKFIDEFVMQTAQLPLFIQMLSQSWTGMWNRIYYDPVLTYSRKVHYLELICINAGMYTIKKLNGRDRLISRFFSEHDDILQKLSGVEHEKMNLIIPELEISFSKLKIEGVDNDVLSCIFDNRFYSINHEMIHNVVKYKDAALCDQLKKQNYTTVVSLGYTPLIDYIHENLPVYIDNIVLCGENRHENINQIIELIKRSITDIERCKKIIQFESFCLSNISQCCGGMYSEHAINLEKVWNALLSHGKVEPTWENVDRFWKNFGLTDTLLAFISENADILTQKSSACLDDAFRQEIIQSDIEPPVFRKLLKHIQLSDFDVPLENISEENVEVMIKERYLVFSAETYEELGDCYPSLCELIILENKDSFVAMVPNIPLESEVFESLILSEETDDRFKESIIKHHGAKLMSEAVAEQICCLKLSIAKDVFDAAWQVLDENEKKTLMIDHMDILKAEDFEECFEFLGADYQGLTDRSRRHNVGIPDSEEHRKLVKRLQQVDYITSFDIGGSIKGYDSSMQKMVDVPTILCRVKASGDNKVLAKA